MSTKKLKFVFAGGVILMALTWLGFSGFEESKSYYKTVDELMAMGNDVYDLRIKVAGDVVEGSIEKNNGKLSFVIEQNGVTVPVRYTGKAPVPDTFVDGAQVVAEGRYARDQVFDANKIQAKCASKYESEYATDNQGKEAL